MKMIKFFKKNRIIIESLVYIMLLISITYLYLKGGIIFKFIPTLFIFGFIGNVLFKRPVITALFSFVTSLTISQMLNQSDIVNNLINSSYLSILVILGECTGYFFINLKNNKDMSKIKYIMNFIYLVIIIFSAIMLNDFNNGNLYKYIEAKAYLNNYFKTEYSYENIELLNAKFIRGDKKYYSFQIKLDGKTYEYLVESNNNLIVDKNITRFSKKKVLEINNILNSHITNNDINIPENFKVEFVNKNDTLKLNLKISLKTNKKENLDNFLLNANNILNSIIQINEISNINDLELEYINNDTSLYTILDNRYLLDFSKYKEAFDIIVSKD